ncbi:MAG: UDP-N-acetylmuramoyl-tripeptide--D-alanyl-D-alanine ligase [Magnetococcales bacterium]|nr:UDP-N-acetylmuramoyl-tripeptide--D-alanyl-D-alanine ligase [Magnetococcales bacterium]
MIGTGRDTIYWHLGLTAGDKRGISMQPDLDFIVRTLNLPYPTFPGVNPELSGFSIDTRTLSHGQLFAALSGPNFDGHGFISKAVAGGAAALLVEHDWEGTAPIPILRVRGVLDALTGLAQAWRRQVNPIVIAVTGSSGKTSVKEMITSCLKESFASVHATRGNLNNHIGLPLTLLDMPSDCQVLVAEMGMSAAGEITHLAGVAEPDIGVVTNVHPAHLAAFANVEAIARAKGELLQALSPDHGIAIYPSQRWETPLLKSLSRARHYMTFGADDKADVTAHQVVLRDDGMDFDLRLPGGVGGAARLAAIAGHVLDNALAAAAAAHAAKTPLPAIIRGLDQFRLQKGRGGTVASAGGWLVIDDTYNANPGSMKAALARLGRETTHRRLAVLGDMLELGESAEALHEELATAVVNAGISQLFTTGCLMSRLADRLQGHPTIEVFHRQDAGEWVGVLPGLCQPGDRILVKGSRGMKMERIVEDLCRHAV